MATKTKLGSRRLHRRQEIVFVDSAEWAAHGPESVRCLLEDFGRSLRREGRVLVGELECEVATDAPPGMISDGKTIVRLFAAILPGPIQNRNGERSATDLPLFDEVATKIASGVMDDVLCQYLELDKADYHHLTNEIAGEVDSQSRFFLIGAVARRLARRYRGVEWIDLSTDLKDSIIEDACAILGIAPSTIANHMQNYR